MSYESLFKGYPHEGGPKSKELFPNRPDTAIEDEKVVITINHDHYKIDWTDADAKQPNRFTDFLLHRLHDFNCALKVAETQISDMQAAYPFLPQDFGFFPKEIPDGKGGNIRVYEADGIGLMRDNTTEKENMWWLIQPNKSNIQLFLPSNHIAFAALKALCLYNPKLDEETVVGEASMSKEDQAVINDEAAKKHDWKSENIPASESEGKKIRTSTCSKCGIEMSGPWYWKDEFMMSENSIDPVCERTTVKIDEN